MSTTPDATTPKFPDVTAHLTGTNGNAFAIIGTVTRELRRAGHGDHIEQFQNEATAGDYDHLLQTAMRWVEVR